MKPPPPSALIAFFLLATTLPSQSPAPSEFKTQIQPILQTNCYPCHSGNRPPGGLRLDARSFAMRAITPKQRRRLPPHPARRRSQRRNPKCPSASPRSPPQQNRRPKNLGLNNGAPSPDSQAGEEHWSYLKPVKPAVPSVKDPTKTRRATQSTTSRPKARCLEKENLHPSPEADKATLIRRLSLDLIGLPPTPAEVAAFLNDARPDAYDRLLERLLASPQYAERRGRMWLQISPATPIPTATKKTIAAPCRPTAIGSSTPSTPTCTSTSSPSSNSPATCCPTPPTIRKSPPAFSATPSSATKAASIPKRTTGTCSSIAPPPSPLLSSVPPCWLRRMPRPQIRPLHAEAKFYQMVAFFNNADFVKSNSTPFTEPVLDLPDAAQKNQTRRPQRREIKTWQAKLNDVIPTKRRQRQQAWDGEKHCRCRKRLASAPSRSCGFERQAADNSTPTIATDGSCASASGN